MELGTVKCWLIVSVDDRSGLAFRSPPVQYLPARAAKPAIAPDPIGLTGNRFGLRASLTASNSLGAQPVRDSIWQPPRRKLSIDEAGPMLSCAPFTRRSILSHNILDGDLA